MFRVFVVSSEKLNLHHHLKRNDMKISILDYSFTANEQVVIFSTEEAKPSGNVYEFSPTPAQVIDMGIALNIVDSDDYEDGTRGQELRVGVDVFGTDKIRYFSYIETIDCISGESLELIALRLAEKEWQRICKEENTLVENLI
jgi:hypothetical protein